MIKSVFIDTAPLIYFLEGHEPFASMAHNFFAAAQISGMELFTSTVTDAEILVHPYRNGDLQKVKQYREVLGSLNINKILIDEVVADTAALIRAKYPSIKGLDAMQIAACINSRCDTFLTNDKQLLQVSEVNATLLEKL